MLVCSAMLRGTRARTFVVGVRYTLLSLVYLAMFQAFLLCDMLTLPILLVPNVLMHLSVHLAPCFDVTTLLRPFMILCYPDLLAILKGQ